MVCRCDIISILNKHALLQRIVVMLEAQASEENSTAPRTWHKAQDISLFIEELSVGKIRGCQGHTLSMDKELIVGILSNIDSKELFVRLATELSKTDELTDGYDVYVVSRTKFFSAHSELLKAHAIPNVNIDTDEKCERIYELIDYYGADRITPEEIRKVFFESADFRTCPIMQDAWHLGCYAINNIALCDVLSAYAAYSGIAKPTPFIDRPTIERVEFAMVEGGLKNKLCISLEHWTTVQEPVSAVLHVGGQPLLSIDPSKADDFIKELQALGSKYSIG